MKTVEIARQDIGIIRIEVLKSYGKGGNYYDAQCWKLECINQNTTLQEYSPRKPWIHEPTVDKALARAIGWLSTGEI